MSALTPTITARPEYSNLFKQQLEYQYIVARTTAVQRIGKLQRLHDCILRHREDIRAAMMADFQKNHFETDISELGVACGEIRHAIRHLRSWMTPKSVGTPLALTGAISEIMYEPKGVCLIISPWNFPFNLSFAPLCSAIAAGNCVVLKPSEFNAHSSPLIKKIVSECFEENEVAVLEGDALVAQELLSLPFNHVFFTGSPAVGKIVMAAAAKHLSSVTLELGGKNPVFVDETADLDITANKLIWTRTMNAGQSCVSPDYVLVHESNHDALVAKLGEKIKNFYGQTPEAVKNSPDYCRLNNPRHFERVAAYLETCKQHGAVVAHGGHTDAAQRYVAPTILTHIADDCPVWDEEIFGPIIMVRPYRDLDEAIRYVNKKPQALALYVFSRNSRNIEHVLSETRSGNASINDAEIHFFNPNLPFGGVNNSGIGKSHGEFGFLEFSNARGICRQNRIFPGTNLFHPPYGKSTLLKWVQEAIVKWL